MKRMFKDDRYDGCDDQGNRTWVNRLFDISIPRSIDQFKKSFLRWRKKKLIMGGISSITRSIMYILILIITLMEGGLDDPFPFLFGILIGLRGIHLLLSGSFKLRGAYRSMSKTRSDKEIVEPMKLAFYRSLWLIYIVPILTYLFILPTLITPFDVSRGYSWYIWPLIFIIYWLIWRIVLRVLIHAYVRAYIVGNKLARVHHDKRIIRKGYKDISRSLIRLINSSYIPIISLLLIVIITGFLKVIYSIFRTFVMEKIFVDTIADLIIDTILEGNFSLNETVFPSLPIWMTPLLLYFLNIGLIFSCAYMRSRIRSDLYNRKGFKSSMGRLIDIFMGEGEISSENPDKALRNDNDPRLGS